MIYIFQSNVTGVTMYHSLLTRRDGTLVMINDFDDLTRLVGYLQGTVEEITVSLPKSADTEISVKNGELISLPERDQRILLQNIGNRVTLGPITWSQIIQKETRKLVSFFNFHQKSITTIIMMLYESIQYRITKIDYSYHWS